MVQLINNKTVQIAAVVTTAPVHYSTTLEMDTK